jgi:hypothetical protein
MMAQGMFWSAAIFFFTFARNAEYTIFIIFVYLFNIISYYGLMVAEGRRLNPSIHTR